MKKLNNKGVTLVEILVSFSIAAVIIVSIFNVLQNYQREEQTETIRSDVLSYKNTITKMLQTDIIKANLRGVKLTTTTSANSTKYTFELNFNKRVNSTGTAIYDKKLVIVTSTNGENYITYDDINGGGVKQNVKYSLMNLGKSTSNENFLKFTSIDSNINSAVSGDEVQNGANNGVRVYDASLGRNVINNNARYFKIDISISHTELKSDYHIIVIAPLNYPYCTIS